MHSLHQKGLCTEINLKPLSENDVARYLSQCYRIDGDAAELSNAVYQHSEGIPLFMTALINEFVGGKPNVHGL
ncbi:hypothetical protein N9H39_01375 [Gammaproteobacteria bacterium]|nr:hypothetical protein [Gammaproteobacteria bacterium]